MRIGFCITCKGRTPHLRQTLPANLGDNPGPDSVFVLLDYGSEDGLGEFIQKTFGSDMAKGKLVYYRFNEAPKFRMAHAKNMAHRCAMLEGADVLVNLDADNIAGPGFADYVRDAFMRTKKDPQEIFLWSRMIHGVLPRGVTGRIAVSRNAFLISGGYDEKYETHSPDDKDFNLRLRRLGFCAQEIDQRFLQALNHNDKMRFREYPQAGDPDAITSSVVAICQHARVVNHGRMGVGTVYRNFSPAPITLGPLPTRIFGIGAHKTATRSLHAALTILGLKSGHWENAHWAKAAWVESTYLGKSLALERFYCLSDIPIPQIFRSLDVAYPGSKFILTIRDEEEWLASVQRHFDPRFNPFAAGWDTDPFTHRMHERIYGRQTFKRDVFLAAYRRHNRRVLEYFRARPGDLLIMDMSRGDGWAQLCGFLDLPIPALGYPCAGVTVDIGVTVTEDCSL